MTRPRTHWSDDLLVVRDATAKDRHPMRFVIAIRPDQRASYKDASLPRHVPTVEAGVQIASRITAKALAARPELGRDEVPAAKLPEVSITRFVCVAANPVAQVWLCNADDASPRGRRSKGGKAPQQTPMPHTKGEYMVMIGDAPVVDQDNMIRTYPTRTSADEDAAHYYAVADEETRFHDADPAILYRNASYEVLFSPAISLTHPFVIRHTDSATLVQKRMKTKDDPDREKTFSGAFAPPRREQIGDDPARFRMISGAIGYADDLDRDYRERIGGGFAARLNSWLVEQQMEMSER